MGLDIRILGPWQVSADGRPMPLAGRRRISLLARLSLSAGQPVTAEQLLADVWGESHVATPAKQLHIVVSKLREAVAAHLPGEIIVTVPGGYRLDLPVEHVDAHRFDRLVRDARAARERGESAAAHTLFRQALGLWRGEALSGIEEDWARIEAARLGEERLSALEDDADLRLALGDHQAVIPELAAHVKAHPLRERPRAQLMLALYRASRPSDALAVYRDARRVMVDELGIEPGATLRRLQQAVLAGDPVLDLSPARTACAPAELPAVGAFTARDLELAWLGKALTEIVPGAPAIAAIDGPGGIGKSALAVHAAHAVADRFPDGVLYVDLRGATAGLEPLSPLDALGRLLRSLGLDSSAVPTAVEEAAARYRSLTAGRSLLVILDNALDARQVRPLLPAGEGCVVIITSRQALNSLDGVNHLSLAELDPDDSTTLLARIAGPARVHAEPEAAVRIVRLCGGLPLALRIAAARLAARPDWTLSYLADRLSDATRRLDTLEHADLAVRASLAVSLHHLREEPAGQDAPRLFALLGLLDTPEHTPAAAAALADRPEHSVEAAMDRLLEARLLEPASPGRYRMHDLVRLYARELATRDIPEPERSTATHRALHHYFATARTASLLLNSASLNVAALRADRPGVCLSTLQEAIAWTESERDNLVAAVRQADDPATVTGLAASVHVPFSHRGWLGDLIEIQRHALATAVRAGDWVGQAQGHNYLGTIHKNQGKLEPAVAHLEQSIQCWERTGQPARGAGTLHNLATTYGRLGRFDDALAAEDRAIVAARERGLRDYEAVMLNGQALVLIKMGRLDDAIETGRKSLDIWPDFDNPYNEGSTCGTLADAYRYAGRPAEAEPLYRRAVQLMRRAGHRAAEAMALWGLGDALKDLERHADARACWHQSARTLRDIHLLTEEELNLILSKDVPPPPEQLKHF